MKSSKVYKIEDNDFIAVELGQTAHGIKRSVFVLVDVRDKLDLDLMLNRHAQIEAEKIAATVIDAALLKMTKSFLNINHQD